MHSSVSEFPCPWCRTPLKKLDTHPRNVSDNDLMERPPVECMLDRALGDVWQKGGTCDMFRFRTHVTIVPPPLHIKLGVVNKILASLDLTVKFLEHKYEQNENEDNCFKVLLSASLSKCGARREKYYSRKMSGGPCSNLMHNMAKFCTLFFHTRIEEYGTVSELVPEVAELEKGLLSTALMYNDSPSGSRKGLGFFFGYQGRWSDEMLEEWNTVCTSFFRRLKAAIWRPKKKRGQTDTYPFYKVPLRMPKVHAMNVHVRDFVKKTGYWALFGEESFEHYQHIGSLLRSKHSHNLCAGAQLCSNLHYAWLRCSCIVAEHQAQGENRAIENGFRAKKRKFATQAT